MCVCVCVFRGDQIQIKVGGLAGGSMRCGYSPLPWRKLKLLLVLGVWDGKTLLVRHRDTKTDKIS